MGQPLHYVYVCMINEITKTLCKQYLKHFHYEGFLNIFDNFLDNEANDSFAVITKK